MPRLRLTLIAAIALPFGATATTDAATPLPAQIDLPVMRTSIYIGSVKLTTSRFIPAIDTYTATYEAKVSPWTWWSEAGTVALTVNTDDHERLLRGETIEITGEARNDQGELREVSARVRPTDATTGLIKVRITAGGTTLIFNSTYVTTVGANPQTTAGRSAPR